MPPPGPYFIRNAAAPALTVNFNGPNAPLTVEPFNGGPAQQWQLVGPPGGMQSIAPIFNQALQTSPQAGFVAPDPPPFLWNLVGPGMQSTIAWVQPAQPELWGIVGAAPGTPVALAAAGVGNQNWIFENVNAD
ncbi:hypothetical protein OG21DRAFT_1518354 [Imleria badia]|nr:hypothetical protein OG21DRAFT_1518354 [Imleria badia]